MNWTGSIQSAVSPRPAFFFFHFFLSLKAVSLVVCILFSAIISRLDHWNYYSISDSFLRGKRIVNPECFCLPQWRRLIEFSVEYNSTDISINETLNKLQKSIPYRDAVDECLEWTARLQRNGRNIICASASRVTNSVLFVRVNNPETINKRAPLSEAPGPGPGSPNKLWISKEPRLCVIVSKSDRNSAAVMRSIISTDSRRFVNRGIREYHSWLKKKVSDNYTEDNASPRDKHKLRVKCIPNTQRPVTFQRMCTRTCNKLDIISLRQRL